MVSVWVDFLALPNMSECGSCQRNLDGLVRIVPGQLFIYRGVL